MHDMHKEHNTFVMFWTHSGILSPVHMTDKDSVRKNKVKGYII